MKTTKSTFAILVGVFVLILVYNVPVKADFSPNSYNSIEDCIKATQAQIVLTSDKQYPDAKCGERIRVPTAPKAISYPTNATQVSWLVQCSTKFNLRPVPRSGGHSSEGYSSENGSVVIDLSYMDSVNIDSSSSTAQVGGGCRLGPLYIKLDKAGYTIVSGLHPTVGLSGIIGAGGWGLQSRQYGTTGEFVLGAEMVDADGNIITASDTSNQDLFWALRGGGGGTFGIVTSWTLKLIPAWSQVTVFHIGYPLMYAEQVITTWTNWAWTERNDMTTTLTITNDGPLIDEHQYGIKIRGHFLGTQQELLPIVDRSGIDNITNIVCVEYMSCDNLGSRAYFLGDDYNCSRTDLFNIGNNPYASVNYSLSIVDTFTNKTSTTTTYSVTYNGGAGDASSGIVPNFKPGPLQVRELEKSKSMYFNGTLTVAQINVITTLIKTLPAGAFLQFDSYGGVFANQSNNMTAFSHRSNTAFHVQIGVALTGKSDHDSLVLRWIESWDTDVRPFSNGQSYVGYVDSDIKTISSNPLAVYYGDNVPRLSIIKAKYDSKNVFTNSLEDNLSSSSGDNSNLCCVAGTCRLPSIRNIRRKSAAVSLKNNRDTWFLIWLCTFLATVMGMGNFFQLIAY